MLDNGVNRTHARTTRDADHVLVGRVQLELAERTGQGHLLPGSVSFRQPGRQFAPRHQTNVERMLARILRLRGTGKGIRTWFADARDTDRPELARLPDLPFMITLHHDLVGVVRQVPHTLDPPFLVSRRAASGSRGSAAAGPAGPGSFQTFPVPSVEDLRMLLLGIFENLLIGHLGTPDSCCATRRCSLRRLPIP